MADDASLITQSSAALAGKREETKRANRRAILDAARIGDGPLAQAWLPHTVPLGFHGHFAPA